MAVPFPSVGVNLLVPVAPSRRPACPYVRIAAAFLLALAAPPVLADDTENTQWPPPDYSMCKACDVHSEHDPEALHFAGMIAETRWAMEQRDSGIMVIRNDEGDEGHWRWMAEEGVVAELEPVNGRR